MSNLRIMLASLARMNRKIWISFQNEQRVDDGSTPGNDSPNKSPLLTFSEVTNTLLEDTNWSERYPSGSSKMMTTICNKKHFIHWSIVTKWWLISVFTCTTVKTPRVLQMSASQHLMVFVFLYGCLSMM